MQRRAIARLVLLGWAVSLPLLAQRYNFKFYGEEEGLENQAVQVFLQDHIGFLWAGTQNGLFRYDGSRFTGFTRSNGLPSSRIESLHESADGTLWVGTRSGLARLAGERFEPVPIRLPDGSAANGILGREAIATDSQGRLYLSTNRGLVVGSRTNTNAWRFEPIASPDEKVSSVYVGAGGVWFGCGKGLCALSGSKAEDVGIEQGLPLERWDTILANSSGMLCVRSQENLYCRPAGSNRFEPRPGLPESKNTYPALAFDPLGRLLVPTDAGLARETSAGWDSVLVDDGHSASVISSVLHDREGSVWIGLLGSGLARWLGYNQWKSWTDRQGLSQSVVWSIAQDHTGRMWVGTQAGLDYADPVVSPLGKVVWKKKPLAGIEMVRSIATNPDDTLWIGAGTDGLAQLDIRTGRLRKFGEAEGLANADVLDVMVDSRRRVWVATRHGLFMRPDAQSKFARLFPDGKDQSETFVNTLEDASGNIWACGDFGLARLAGETWTRFTTKDGLKANMVAQVAAERDGSIWLGYRDAFGISHLRFTSGAISHVEHYAAGKGLRSDKSIFLSVDQAGELWVGTDHGVDVLDRGQWRHFGRADGLVWDDCNTNAFLAAEDGSVWIGTSRGLSRFEPASVAPTIEPPPVVFTSVKFGDQTVDPSGVIKVPWKQRSLEVSFAALTFTQESNVRFRYRLTGETRWIETSERTLTFPTLSPGDFALEVMARNAAGNWDSALAKLQFQIANPWWMTTWFQALSALLALLLGKLMWQRRTRRLEAERQRLEIAVTERTQELSQEKLLAEQEKSTVQQQKGEIERLLAEAKQSSRLKSEFLANMSHEIRTPMNGVLGMTDLVLATPLSSEQRDYLETARLSADSLLTILNDVLDFSKIEAGRLDLNPIEFSLRDCIEQSRRMLALSLSTKRLEFATLIDNNVPDRLVGDPDRLRQILLNLIGNAIKFTSEGKISVKVLQEAQQDGTMLMHFAVTDTGLGIPSDKQQLIFEAFRQADGSTTRKFGGTGLGLAICSRLVQLMGGSIRVESEPGRGSTFHFSARFCVVSDAESNASGLRALLKAVSAPALGPLESFRILLAEDNAVNQKLASRLLEKRGHRVTVANSGREAVERTRQQSFDLILMDVQMPDMDGLEAAALIRANERNTRRYTPIIALTAHTMKGDRERALAAGMDDFITKPVDANRLIEVVESTAALHQRQPTTR